MALSQEYWQKWKKSPLSKIVKEPVKEQVEKLVFGKYKQKYQPPPIPKPDGMQKPVGKFSGDDLSTPPQPSRWYKETYTISANVAPAVEYAMGTKLWAALPERIQSLQLFTLEQFAISGNDLSTPPENGETEPEYIYVQPVILGGGGEGWEETGAVSENGTDWFTYLLYGGIAIFIIFIIYAFVGKGKI